MIIWPGDTEQKKMCIKTVLSVYLPVRVVQGRPVLGRRSCQGCRAHGGQGLVAGCPEACQHSHREGKNHLTLRQREKESERTLSTTYHTQMHLI